MNEQTMPERIAALRASADQALSYETLECARIKKKVERAKQELKAAKEYLARARAQFTSMHDQANKLEAGI